MKITQSLPERFRRMSGAVDFDPDACWSWRGSKDARGYGRIHVDRKGYPRKAHRVSWLLHFGEIPAGIEVCHRCDNPSCANPRHLFLGTHAANMADAKAKGRPLGPRAGVVHINVGEANPQAKLTAQQVDEIRRLASEGVLQRIIGTRYGVSQRTVSKIVLGLRWPSPNKQYPVERLNTEPCR